MAKRPALTPELLQARSKELWCYVRGCKEEATCLLDGEPTCDYHSLVATVHQVKEENK